MNDTKNAPKQEQSKIDPDIWVTELLWMFKRELKRLESLEETDPETTKQELERASKVLRDFMGNTRLYIRYTLGMQDFLKRAKRRATRKPVTVNRLNGLVDDLDKLREILRIEY